MTARGRALAVIALSALYSGLSLGGRIFYLAAVFAMLALFTSLLCVLLARRALTVSCQINPVRVPRGEQARLTARVRCRIPLPLASLSVIFSAAGERVTQPLTLRRGEGEIHLDIPARHIGEWPAGVEEIILCDILGLFRVRARKQDESLSLLALPRSFEVEPLRFLQSDEGRSLQNRTTEDLSSPEDTRGYRAGDPLKRVHWKLTARKRELIVRKFETPAPPDTLILMDCTAPEETDDPETAAGLRDTLCETVLSVAEMQARGDIPVRVPMYGEHAAEFLSGRGSDIGALAEMLARQTFLGGVEFYRVLHLELRRMRRTGATVIVTSRLNAEVVEGVIHIRRMGPSARVYYVTHTPDAPEDKPYIAQLQQNLVEVCYVKPA